MLNTERSEWNFIVIRLIDILSQLRGMDEKLELTDVEEDIMRFVVDAKIPVTTTEVSERIGIDIPSLKYRTHTDSFKFSCEERNCRKI